MSLRMDELYGRGVAQFGGPSFVKLRQVWPNAWAAGRYIKVGALEAEAGLKIGGVSYSVAEVYSGKRPEGYAITLVGSKIEFEFVPLEWNGVVRLLEEGLPPEECRLAADAWTYSIGGVNEPRTEWEVVIEIEPWNNPDRPVVGSKPRRLTIYRAHVVHPIERTFKANAFGYPTIRMEGIISSATGGLETWENTYIRQPLPFTATHDRATANLTIASGPAESWKKDEYVGWAVQYVGSNEQILADPFRLIVANAASNETPLIFQLTHAYSANITSAEAFMLARLD